MAYDETLAARVRKALGRRRALSEKKMFGGVGFMLGGNMCCGILGTSLVVRLAPEQGAAALGEPNVRAFDITGRPMKGWVMVDAPGIAAEEALQRWVGLGATFAATLPPK